MAKIEDLFYVTYGVNLELQNCEIVTNDDTDFVNFVARTSQNNGVVAKVKKIPGITPQEAVQLVVLLEAVFYLLLFKLCLIIVDEIYMY